MIPSTDDTNDTRDTTPDGIDDTDDAPTLSRRRLLGAAAAAGAAGLAGCSTPLVQVRTATDTVERAFDADAVSRIRVDAADDVTVEPADGDTVEVRARKRAHGNTELDELALRSRVEDGALNLATRKPNVVGIGGGSVDLEVFLPDAVAVDRVRTDDGSVSLRGTSGDATVQTGDGDVTASGLGGDLDASTDDGSVTVERVDGTVTARTGDGDVTVRAPGTVGDLRTVDGGLVADVPAVDGSVALRSRDGDVTVALGGSLDATVDATTGDGSVTAAGFDTVQAATDTHVAGTVGDGTDELRIHTDDGDVTLTSMG
jgi:DUF4097 and DUF4098 domain-containing protein YvlB